LKEDTMSNECREIEDAMARQATGADLGDQDQQLRAHLETCASCRESLALLGDFHRAASLAEPEEAEFARMRQNVLRDLAAEPPLPAARFGGFALARLLRPATLALAAAVLFIAGFVTGTTGRGTGGVAGDTIAPASATAELEALAGQMRRVAMPSGQLPETGGSPFSYSNVQIEPAGPDQVRLRFDAAQRLDLRLDKDDPLVSEVLVQSLLGSSSVGARLQAIDNAEGVLEPRVKEALVAAMRHDTNLGVQMQAQAKLISQPHDPAIIEAMLAVLAHEDSVQMRLTAIDYLTARRISRGRLEDALGASSAAANPAVAARADQYLLVTR
jgi:hypothetical protein